MGEDISGKIQLFQQDLNKLLEKYGFTDLYRKIIEDTCVQDAKEQLQRKHAADAYKKNSEAM